MTCIFLKCNETLKNSCMSETNRRVSGAKAKTGETYLFDVNICHALSQAHVSDAPHNPWGMLEADWTAKVSRYAIRVQADRKKHVFITSTAVYVTYIGGWHPDSYGALCSVLTAIAARGFPYFSCATSILFRRYPACICCNCRHYCN